MKKLSVLFLALIALFVWVAPSHAIDDIKKVEGVKKVNVAHKPKKVEKKDFKSLKIL